jgi:hypothetical protein
MRKILPARKNLGVTFWLGAGKGIGTFFYSERTACAQWELPVRTTNGVFRSKHGGSDV